MGHWSAALLEEVSRQLGDTVDLQAVAELLVQAGYMMEAVEGTVSNSGNPHLVVIDSSGLPFAELPDMSVGSAEPVEGRWLVPDPVDPSRAAAMQMVALERTVSRAAGFAEALWAVGLVVARSYMSGAFSSEFVRQQLSSVPQQQRPAWLRRVMDPTVWHQVPIVTADYDGWWIQITRRLTQEPQRFRDDGTQVLEFSELASGQRLRLRALQPTLIMAPMTEQPVRQAFTARLWTTDSGVSFSTKRLWSRLAPMIRDYGIPTITLDPASSRQEIACQLMLTAYWHGYIGGDEPALASAVAAAYPKAVERIQRGTRAPSRQSAAASLLEGLIRPGFNPAEGTEATRRYVRRKASIAVMEHWKREAPQRYPWTRVGISERRFYKLLPLFAEKVNGRYEYDHDDVVERMIAYLADLECQREIRAAAMEVLVSRGFGQEAARKWLQRHQPEDAINARPR